MNNINYKVIFKGLNDNDKFDLVLTFKKITSKKKNTIPYSILSNLKNTSEKNSIVVVFQNIEDVLAIGNDSLTLNYVNYYVVLFTSKLNGEKEGFLIGNEKKKDDLEILGMWPFNSIKDEISKDQILELFNQMINNTTKYDHICLITS